MKITAVVVTYNRLELLKECITAVYSQTFLPSFIIVVDNSSTDGTSEWLSTQKEITTIRQANKGGAWGFYTGIKEAYKTGADWLWIMDDDTIPDATALEELVNAVRRINTQDCDTFGFFFQQSCMAGRKLAFDE